MELPPGQHGLQKIARVHGAVGFAGTHDGVQFIDEQNDLSVALADFLQYGFQAFLKFAAEFGTGDQRTHVQREEGAVFQIIRHITADDPLGQSLGDGGLAHTGLADQAGVVLRLAGQDTDHVADLVIPPDDGIQLLRPGQFHQIAAVFLQHVVGALRVVARYLPMAADIFQRGEKLVFCDPVAGEDILHRPIRRGDQSQHQMLHGNVLVFHVGGLLFRACQCIVQLPG